ncbi:MAG: Omp28-related outer membrane protein, partial [Ignavibacteriae bacterium]|nr:Omp28-related outer membrane protein [Ignavibacteriota bacterium]
MKNLYKSFFFIFLISLTSINASDRKVLVEIFTNSHCPLCPPSHTAINNYLATSNGTNIEYIYYHMVFPYSSDQLYKDNPNDSDNKNNYYGPVSSTPKAYFNGTLVGNSYNNWQSSLDNLVAEQSSFEIALTGNYTENDFTINADITKTAETAESDLTINFVVVENVEYQGQNGIKDHKNVMRKIANVNGDAINISLNETKNMQSTFANNNLWNSSNLRVVVFIQSSSSKNVYQSNSIAFSDLMLTSIESNQTLSDNFKLEQNYPNPFNPSTKINFTIPSFSKENFPSSQNVELVIYDILGNKISTLVNGNKSPGNYEVTFNAENLS